VRPAGRRHEERAFTKPLDSKSLTSSGVGLMKRSPSREMNSSGPLADSGFSTGSASKSGASSSLTTRWSIVTGPVAVALPSSSPQAVRPKAAIAATARRRGLKGLRS
jgi:hypothetical protein